MSKNGALATEMDEKPVEEETADDADADAVDTTHLDGVEAGAGCTEIWEHLSERRERADSD